MGVDLAIGNLDEEGFEDDADDVDDGDSDSEVKAAVFGVKVLADTLKLKLNGAGCCFCC